MVASETANSGASMKGKVATVTITITAAMTAFVFVVTYLLSIPIPSLGGQAVFDAGDIAVFISSLTFGPVVGIFAGGIGSGLSDATYGSFYAPFTLVVKGLEGLLSGYVAFRFRTRHRDILGWALGSVVMVGGYFLTNSVGVALLYGANSSAAQTAGLTVAIGEAPFDTIQVIAGGLLGLPISRLLRSTLPKVFPAPR